MSEGPGKKDQRRFSQPDLTLTTRLQQQLARLQQMNMADRFVLMHADATKRAAVKGAGIHAEMAEQG